jgi:hypothetical protein
MGGTAGTPMLLARDCSQGIVRRHYLGESSLPTVPFSGWVIIAINALECVLKQAQKRQLPRPELELLPVSFACSPCLACCCTQLADM